MATKIMLKLLYIKLYNFNKIMLKTKPNIYTVLIKKSKSLSSY